MQRLPTKLDIIIVEVGQVGWLVMKVRNFGEAIFILMAVDREVHTSIQEGDQPVKKAAIQPKK